MHKALRILGFIVVASLVMNSAIADSSRQDTRLDDNWKFLLGDPQDGAMPTLDDSTWRSVTLPHDWSIEAKIDSKAPMGGGGGFFQSGIGWYRQSIQAPTEWQGKEIQVEFEGVYENAAIYLNGQKLYSRPYGYSTFFVDLTPGLKIGATNLLAVRVDNSKQKNSRWYAGSGIYRHVWLHVTNPIHISNWGVNAETTQADESKAQLKLSTRLTNQTGQTADVTVAYEFIGPKGNSIGKDALNCQVPARGEIAVSHTTMLSQPPLWSPEDPEMCQLVTRITENGALIDSITTPIGIRHLAWSVTDGFTINGKTYKLKGGCIHADNGVLGVCAFDRAEERKVQLLKADGFNALRTAHSPFSPELLNACDRLGMLVMENSFDCWIKGKNAQDYHLYFKDWWKQDLDDMVLRDRNHPSIVLWDIGNETPQIFSDREVASYAPKLVDEVHSLDKTRPVTIASCFWPSASDLPIGAISWDSQDIVGSNYAIGQHIAQHGQFPNRVLLSTESNPPLGEYNRVLNTSYVIGDFVWSAQDYLGESGIGRWFYIGDPTEPLKKPDPKKPGDINPLGHGDDRLYPWHGSNCGLVDILGDPKAVLQYWNVVWQTGPKLGIAVKQPEGDQKIKVVGWGWFPTWSSWTWPGWEQKPMEVEVYSTYAKTRLYLNGQLVGEQPTQNSKSVYHVTYQPGTLKAVGLENGNEMSEVKLVTAGAPSRIQLIPDRKTITADGQGLSFVQVEILDQNGQVQPNADQLITFSLFGPGTIAGLGNADMKSEDPYQGVQCHVFHGRALVVLRSTEQAGTLNLTAQSSGLTSAEVQITTSR